MYDITLKGTCLIEHTICYKYDNVVLKEVNQQHYIEPKEYFKDYFKKISSFFDCDDFKKEKSLLVFFTKHSDDMVINDFEEYFFEDDRITFSFDNEEEALYFNLKYST